MHMYGVCSVCQILSTLQTGSCMLVMCRSNLIVPMHLEGKTSACLCHMERKNKQQVTMVIRYTDSTYE